MKQHFADYQGNLSAVAKLSEQFSYSQERIRELAQEVAKLTEQLAKLKEDVI